MTDASGNLWVEQPRRQSSDLSTWVVVSPEGGMLGTVQLPASRKLLAAGRSAVVLARYDADGLMFPEVRPLSTPW